MPIRYAHTNLVSRDWQKLAQFYIHVFDCTPILPERDLSGSWLDEATDLQNAHIHGIHLRLPGFGENGPTLEIFTYDDFQEGTAPNQPNTLGLGHLAFAVDDVPVTAEKIISHGGRALGRLTTREIPGAGTIQFMYLYDPEGNILEIQSWG